MGSASSSSWSPMPLSPSFARFFDLLTWPATAAAASARWHNMSGEKKLKGKGVKCERGSGLLPFFSRKKGQ